MDLSRNDNQVSGGASFSSFSQERAVLFDRETVGEPGQARGEGVGVLLEWSNLIILGISVATALAFITGQPEKSESKYCVSGDVMGMQCLSNKYLIPGWAH